MTHDVELVDPAMSIRMRDEDIGALPVGENDRLVGMVTDRDIAMRGVAVDKAPGKCPARDVMSGGIYYCYEDDEAQRGATLMAEHRVRRPPVLSSDKRMVGVVSLAYLAKAGMAQPAMEAVSEPTAEHRA